MPRTRFSASLPRYALLALTIGTPLLAHEASDAPPQLVRRAALGVGANSNEPQVVLSSVRPGSAAEKAGMRVGDVLLTLNDKPLANSQALIEALRTTPGGSQATFGIRRNNEALTLSGALDTLPTETLEGHTITYGSVVVPASASSPQPYRVRTIITRPNQIASASQPAAKLPVFVYIQGIYCQTLDRPTALEAADTRLVHDLAREGFITLRIDKAGVGDSQGPPCGSINFTDELTAYIEAIKHIRTLEGVDPDRVYVFGHSMGGVMAPFIAQATPIRGAIVYGTLARSWLEYTLENTRRQMRLAGASEGDVTDAVLSTTRLFAPVFIDKLTPGEVWTKHPDLQQEEGPMLDARRIASRDASFYHQLQDFNIAQAWADANTNVLALHGEFDWVSSQEDHELIAAIVGAREGAVAEFQSVTLADHGLTRHLTLKQSLAAMGQGQPLTSLAKIITRFTAKVEGTQSETSSTQPASPARPASGSQENGQTTSLSAHELFARHMVGSWEGTVITTVANASQVQAPEPFTMKLDVAPTSTKGRFDWTITYEGSAGKQVREYALVTTPDSIAIDENNGIILPASLIGSTLLTTFELGGAHITASYEVIFAETTDARVAFTLVSASPSEAVKAPGGDTLKIWLPTSTQRAELFPPMDDAPASP